MYASAIDTERSIIPNMKHLRLIPLLLILALPATTAALKSGRTTCPTSGVKQLATSTTTSTKAIWISLQTPADNTGTIAFGGTNVVAVASCNGTTVGNCLSAGGTAFLPPVSNTAALDLSQTWFACTVAADVLSYNYLQ